jgi:hypothetical protein
MRILTRLLAVGAVATVIPLVGVSGIASASTHPAQSNPIEVTATPDPVIETGQSQVMAVVQVSTKPAFAGDMVEISSMQLDNTCSSAEFISIGSGGEEGMLSGSPIEVMLDNDGNATVMFNGTGCSAGKQTIEASLVAAPYYSATTCLKVKSPRDTPAGVTAYPQSEVETGTSGEGGNSDVYAVFYVETSSVYAELTAEIQADELVDRCGEGSAWLANGEWSSGQTASTTLDDNGNAVFGFFGASCASGTSDILADIEGGTHPTYMTTFTVVSPRKVI